MTEAIDQAGRFSSGLLVAGGKAAHWTAMAIEPLPNFTTPVSFSMQFLKTASISHFGTATTFHIPLMA